ncbi:translation initiation factor [Sphingobacterium sp. DK4209]|uniref:Translation initiation factor n=1 Tax=Sphingobacterium zhuxiongii TaxID=2662364 RepID=A0A5Q0QIF6_9SPHI|nr:MULTISPECIES: translation initiation factor [unclassified Sphingobacterium]MVZ66783.1 translation initiation factor [Sphingobacterium sp. DK4209]QGA28018.1 translation initiation factor [Sphingobacterium sp. dk4302]
MSKQKKQRFEGIVYSTSDEFSYVESDDSVDIDTLPKGKQKLKVGLDRKARKGKVVTLITGFIGTQGDLDDLAKVLKQKCGVGGSSKDGEILIQGEFKDKIIQYLQSEGYQVKGFGG